jgi:hypothetical protein
MKKSILLICILSLMLFSCDKIKEAITVPVNTTLKVDVPISVAVTKSLNLNDKSRNCLSILCG